MNQTLFLTNFIELPPGTQCTDITSVRERHGIFMYFAEKINVIPLVIRQIKNILKKIIKYIVSKKESIKNIFTNRSAPTTGPPSVEV